MNDKTLMLRFFLRNGSIVTLAVPNAESFNFGTMIQVIRAQGFLLQNDVYIPDTEIVCIGLAHGNDPMQNIEMPAGRTLQ